MRGPHLTLLAAVHHIVVALQPLRHVVGVQDCGLRHEFYADKGDARRQRDNKHRTPSKCTQAHTAPAPPHPLSLHSMPQAVSSYTRHSRTTLAHYTARTAAHCMPHAHVTHTQIGHDTTTPSLPPPPHTPYRHWLCSRSVTTCSSPAQSIKPRDHVNLPR